MSYHEFPLSGGIVENSSRLQLRIQSRFATGRLRGVVRNAKI